VQQCRVVCHITRSSTMVETTHSHLAWPEEGPTAKGVEDDVTDDLLMIYSLRYSYYPFNDIVFRDY
jgi:hypothetical protein